MFAYRFEHCILPEIGEEFWFEQQVSDISYAYISHNFLLLSLYDWNATNIVIFHPFESFQNQFIALYGNNLAEKTT